MMTYVQIKQSGTHQNTKLRNIQALLDMSQRSHTLIAYYYSLSNAIRRSTIYSDWFPERRSGKRIIGGTAFRLEFLVGWYYDADATMAVSELY